MNTRVLVGAGGRRRSSAAAGPYRPPPAAAAQQGWASPHPRPARTPGLGRARAPLTCSAAPRRTRPRRTPPSSLRRRAPSWEAAGAAALKAQERAGPAAGTGEPRCSRRAWRRPAAPGGCHRPAGEGARGAVIASQPRGPGGPSPPYS